MSACSFYIYKQLGIDENLKKTHFSFLISDEYELSFSIHTYYGVHDYLTYILAIKVYSSLFFEETKRM